jgi:diadenosine tetraphosphate (Ap4A) HIT family hydrolase
LVLILDGLYFRFRRKDWVLYMMAVKPCHQNRALFLDPVLLPGRENMQGWSQAFTTIPTRIRRRIRASVSDEISGVIKLGTSHGWIVQLCHFHLISRLQNCRGQRNRRLEGRPLREALYQQVRQALELPDGPRLQTVLEKLRRLVRKATGLRVMRMIVREFLRRIDHFTAYRKYPELDLPTTTGSVEAMNRRVRDLMRQTRSVRSPQALQLWATALIRMRPAITCNGKHFQQKKFV